MFYFYFLVAGLWKRTHFLFHHLLEPIDPGKAGFRGWNIALGKQKMTQNFLLDFTIRQGKVGRPATRRAAPPRK